MTTYTVADGVVVDMESLAAIARAAGAAIMEVYAQDFSKDIEWKADNSPLTLADKAANKVICDSLLARWPSIPIISEENEAIPHATRAAWSHYWLVDPLDGTKEFIKRNGQFTVNIGLCCGAKPVAGVVFEPAAEVPRMYYGVVGQGAFRELEAGKPEPIHVQRFSEADSGLTLVASASHSSPETEAFVAKYPDAKLRSLGSSLKLLMVAEGDAHVYPRLAPTSEWDTCASHAVVEAAGGEVLQHAGGKECTPGAPVEYNKPDLLNPFFVVYGRRT